ncbi:hypothetical protein BDP27DRAFT_1413620 [Rhodocollybia butyracea]|uniref:VWFA domain-containing protein n=1 Tax=Rhodocollybia butyracea TaxID=206335 RepID=A0A9P5UEE6_9AGAR|nr:hypothetical protein BDP27DRAFT_1413620 [Rhodocollybia butyracea]
MTDEAISPQNLQRALAYAVTPSNNDVASFIAAVPFADEKTATMFLEGASNIDEAISQYFDNPDRYSHTKEETKRSQAPKRPHTNAVIDAGYLRARDEQDMQNSLQNLQRAHGIYNDDIEPEHDYDYPCGCDIHEYKKKKMGRLGVQEAWSRAVMYPGETYYHDCYQNNFGRNPYRSRVVSPFRSWIRSSHLKPNAQYYTRAVQQTIQLNPDLNAQAQAYIDAKEPSFDIWAVNQEPTNGGPPSEQDSITAPLTTSNPQNPKRSRFSRFKMAIVSGLTPRSATPKSAADQIQELRDAILDEEDDRWPDPEWRQIVATYQEKLGISTKVTYLRNHQPIQYLHLLRAGYFEAIPVAWANQNSNPLNSISMLRLGGEEERSVGTRMKPDRIFEMNMARARMATAVPPPPAYYSPNDTCHLQHTSGDYSRQVMPPPFRLFGRPEVSTDNTMILLDVSESMNFDPVRPNYDQCLITGYSRSTQPKNKDVAKAITRRFTDAMANHDHNFQGYQLITFSSKASYIGVINHENFTSMWRNIRIGGGTRVMTATYHPVYGWQAGMETPTLGLLLLLDGEATDMDEFELELLGLSWVHVTIFLIGVDGCPHHHRHANELQRISEVNHHISFVDAQGNTPERFVTHELLKRHLGYDVSMAEFEELEQLPGYAP